VSAHLIDDQVLTLSGPELVRASKIFDQYISQQTSSNGAAPDLGFATLARRGANITKRRFAVETTKRNLEIDEAESSPQVDQSQAMSAVEAAEYLGITEQWCRRIRHKIGVLPGKAIMFDRDDVIAYKHQRKEGTAA
jgi:hypothetical protein